MYLFIFIEKKLIYIKEIIREKIKILKIYKE